MTVQLYKKFRYVSFEIENKFSVHYIIVKMIQT